MATSAPSWWGQSPISGLNVIENQYLGTGGAYRPYRYDVSGLQRATGWDGYVGPGGVQLDSKGRVLGQYSEGANWFNGGGSAPGTNGFDPMSIPFYAQAVAQSKAQGEAEKAQGIANIRQQLIQFGLVPENFQDKWGALDDTTKALIQKNTDTGISAYARMLDDRKYGITDFVNRLSATGMRRSGTKGAGLRRRQLAFDRNLQDALGALLGNIGGVYNAWSNSEYGRSQYLTNLLAQVYSQYYQPSGGGGGGSAPVASQPQTGYGNYGSYTYSAGTGPTQGYDETRFTGTPGRFLD